MSCGCGFEIIEIVGSGGARLSGSATVATVPNVYQEVGSGGAVAGASATVLTNHVFDDFNGVFHLVENGNGTPGEYHDSAEKNDGTAAPVPNSPTKTVSNLWAYCQAHEATDWITVPIDEASGDYTVSFWFKPTGRFINRVMFSRGLTDSVDGEGVSIAIGYTPFNRLFARVKLVGESNWTTYNIPGSTDLTSGCWYHVALVIDGGSSITLYLDGEVDRTRAITETAMVPATSLIQFGRDDIGEPFVGELQEVRFAPVARAAGWIEAEHDTLCSGSYTESAEESPVYN